MNKLNIVKTVYYELRFDLHPPYRYLVDIGLCDDTEISKVLENNLCRLEKDIGLDIIKEDLVFYIRKRGVRLPYNEI